MIFPRRIVQRAILDNTRFVSVEQATGQVARLNSGKAKDALATVWEIIVLNALSKMGTVRYEPNVGRGGLLDIEFSSNGISFVADIATVSDDGLDKDNPVWAFQRMIGNKIRRAGLLGNRFDIRVGGQLRGRAPSRQKMTLSLPKRNTLEKELGSDFHDFLQHIKADDPAVASYKHTGVADVHISYQRDQKFASASYPSYAVPYSLTENPVFNALKKKARQLKAAQAQPLKGIVLCDGGCDLLQRKSRTHNTHNLADVVAYCLDKYSSISFIVVIYGDRPLPEFLSRQPAPHLAVQFFPSRNLSEDFGKRLNRLFQHMASLLPEPDTEPYNARHKLAGAVHYYHREKQLKGCHMSATQIKISSRALLNLMAGRMSQEEFSDFHKSSRTNQHNIFEHFMQQGKLISGTTLERDVTADDDWIVFDFSWDAAISSFTVKPPESR